MGKTEYNELTSTVKVESDDSSWFSGHFPDDPILPGIAQLKMVADLIAASGKEKRSVTGLSRIKFRKIVRPGELLDIHAASGKNSDHYSFRIECGDAIVCSGIIHYAQQ